MVTVFLINMTAAIIPWSPLSRVFAVLHLTGMLQASLLLPHNTIYISNQSFLHRVILHVYMLLSTADDTYQSLLRLDAPASTGKHHNFGQWVNIHGWCHRHHYTALSAGLLVFVTLAHTAVRSVYPGRW